MNIRELAKIAGVSKSTAAYALNNDPRIRPELRRRILALAEEHGYTRSPLISGLMKEVRSGEVHSRSLGLAYLMWGKKRAVSECSLSEKGLIQGALQMAEQLGYSLEIMAWEAEGYSENRLSKVLNARGIRGVFIGPAREPHSRLNLDWSGLAVVASGYTMEEPHVDRIAADLTQGVELGVHQILDHGYRQAVVVLPAYRIMERVGFRWLSSARVQQAVLGEERVVILEDDGSSAACRPMVAFAKKNRIAFLAGEDLLTRLSSAGLNVPRDAGFVALDRREDVASVVQPHQTLGEQAIVRLAKLVEMGRWGIPGIPCRITLECQWQEGGSLISGGATQQS